MSIDSATADAAPSCRPAEVIADGAVHGIGLVGSIAGGVVLMLAAARGGAREVVVAAVYLSGLIAMFGCSGAYNLWRTSRCGTFLQRLDHSAIFVMIAGSYTPFLALFLEGAWAVAMTALVWGVAGLGIAARFCLPAWFARTRIVFYLVLGWSGLLVIEPLTGAVGSKTMFFLGMGGLVYTLGIVFHLWRALPFQNVIWHLFVLAGASLHYVAVFNGVVAASERLHVALAAFA